MTNTPERDPLEELLAPPRPADTAALRRATLVSTTRRLRRRRWSRRAILAAALAACYVAGLLTMRLLAPAPQDVIVQLTPQPPQQEGPPVAVAPPEEPEWRGDSADRERVVLLRQAGDRYLDQDHDPAAALRCYKEALEAGSADDAKFSADDNWLLMAIKNAREKETRHADNDG